MARTVARVTGVALRPGMSLNRRIYTKAAIAKMVARVRRQIAAGDGPAITMRTHHDAGDDPVRLVGRVRSMDVADDGSAVFSADLADTPHGRTIAALADTSDGQPAFLRGVSIRGAWAGPARTVTAADGEPAETGDDLTLHGLDFTASPGVPGARVDALTWAAPRVPVPGESAGTGVITESAPALVVPALAERSTPMSKKKARRALREALTAAAVLGTEPVPPASQVTPSQREARAILAKPLHALTGEELGIRLNAAVGALAGQGELAGPYYQSLR